MERWFRRAGTISDEFWEDWEGALIQVDVGVETSLELVARVRERASREKNFDPGRIREMIREELAALFPPVPAAAGDASAPPRVTVLWGVNGSGKTTTAAKLAGRCQAAGEKVLLAAADTFRAAAIDQLEIWARRLGVEIVSQESGSDPAAVAFDACRAARARGYDRVIVDTAGRLHTRDDLMGQVGKLVRSIEKAVPGSPREMLLVVDATVGQNGLAQAEKFMESVKLDGVVLTKLDGTARGGIAAAIGSRFKIPIVMVGVGEGPEDLAGFDAAEFSRALLTAPETVGS